MLISWCPHGSFRGTSYADIHHWIDQCVKDVTKLSKLCFSHIDQPNSEFHSNWSDIWAAAYSQFLVGRSMWGLGGMMLTAWIKERWGPHVSTESTPHGISHTNVSTGSFLYKLTAVDMDQTVLQDVTRGRRSKDTSQHSSSVWQAQQYSLYGPTLKTHYLPYNMCSCCNISKCWNWGMAK